MNVLPHGRSLSKLQNAKLALNYQVLPDRVRLVRWLQQTLSGTYHRTNVDWSSSTHTMMVRENWCYAMLLQYTWSQMHWIATLHTNTAIVLCCDNEISMLSAHNGELISKNLFIDRADRINGSGGGRFIIIIISYVQSIGRYICMADALLESSRKFIHQRGGNLTLIFLIAAHFNHFTKAARGINFSHAARFLRNNIARSRCLLLLFSLRSRSLVIFCKFKLTRKGVWVFIPTGASQPKSKSNQV